MIATLPMYDPVWLRPANDRLWAHLAERLRTRGLRDVPPTLERAGDLTAMWRAPSLLLGQTCGYPLVKQLAESVQVVATPHYDAEGCEGPHHRAAIVVRHDDPARSLTDLRGQRAGVNDHASNSGMNLFRAAISTVADGPRFFSCVTRTGSHARSIAAVRSGRIDVASIDGVTLALLRERYPRQMADIRVLDWTVASPSLPFITAPGTPDATIAVLRDELVAIARNASDLLSGQRITGFSLLSIADYQPLLALEKDAAGRGYSDLA